MHLHLPPAPVVCSPPHPRLNSPFPGLSAISESLLSAVFAFFEILLTDIPASSWLLLPFGILLLLLYIGLGFIVFATQGSYSELPPPCPLRALFSFSQRWRRIHTRCSSR